MRLQWTPSISVGNAAIDKQHQELFDKANIILEAMAQGKGKEQVGALITFIESYVIKHFNDEQMYLQSIRYPNLSDHVKHHDAFRAEFAGLKQKFLAEGPTVSSSIALNKLVAEWLRNHISNTDQEYARFVKAA